MSRMVLALIALLLSEVALADSGRILYVNGRVTVERDGKLYRAVPRAKVISGDKISTGADGRLHLRMSDETLISLKPDTDFVIQRYRFAQARHPGEATGASQSTQTRRPTATQATADEPDSSVFNLLKGGFRAITGLIGQRNRNAFSVSTPVATIGIRGTSFVADLEPVPGGPATASRQLDGLMLASAVSDTQYDFGSGPLLAQAGGGSTGNGFLLTVGVGQGRVILSNNQGSILLENGEFGQVHGVNGNPRRIVRPLADNEARSRGGAQGEDEDRERRTRRGGDPANRVLSTSNRRGNNKDDRRPDQEADETVIPDPIVGPRRDVAMVSALTAGGRNTQTITASTTALRQDANGQVTGFISAIDRNGRTVAAAVGLTGGTVVDAGLDPETRLRWGRWSGAEMSLRFRDGSGQQIDPDTVQLHLIASPVHEGRIAVPTTGSRDFVLIGNTNPTDASGNIGILGDAALRANFDSQTVQSSLNLSINEQVWQASGNGLLGRNLTPLTPANVFAGQYGNVQVGNSAGGNGEFSGFLTPAGRGAGLSYELNHGGSTVTGVAAFGAN